MLPALKPGQHCFVLPYYFSSPKINDVVLARDPRNNALIIKRIAEVQKMGEHNLYTLHGDNAAKSTDSRQLGQWDRKNILGRIFV